MGDESWRGQVGGLNESEVAEFLAEAVRIRAAALSRVAASGFSV